MDYQEFIKSRIIHQINFGFHCDLDDLNPMLKDWQKVITRWALRKGRCSIFSDCGTGKTFMQLEWARKVLEHTGMPVLIVAPLAVSSQTQREAVKFGIDAMCIQADDDVYHGINIINYEKIHKIDASVFGGVVFDESSIFKGTNYKKTFQLCLEKFCKTHFILCCTATPAPNDFPELGNHSEILRVKKRGEMQSEFFVHDSGETSKYRLMGWGENKFWAWVCTWAVCVRKPSDIGYSDEGFYMPDIEYHEHILDAEKPLDGKMFVEKVVGMSERRKVRSSTIRERTDKAAEIVNSIDGPVLVWCDLNNESQELARKIDGAVEVSGSHSNEYKATSMIDFADGKIKALVSKPQICGFGMNFQVSHHAVFVGLSDSYERFYQAIRRQARYGQTKTVHVHIILNEREGSILDNIRRKEADAEKMAEEMIKNMSDLFDGEMEHDDISEKFSTYSPSVETGENWMIYNEDCVDVARRQPDNSIGYMIYSPPFASLYTYSDSERDMGNAKSYEDFFEHYKFLITEKFRTLMPGRVCSVHCMNIPAMKERDGYIGLKNFRDDIIRVHQDAGFIYHSEVVIWKDPLIEATRTKAIGLMHKQLCKDSAMCRQGLPDYLVTFGKPGKNEKPITHPDGITSFHGENPPKESGIKQSHNIFRRYASPVWMDINQSRTLNVKHARENRDERHICPLQLDVIARGLELWSLPGDLVASWFAGIGSEGYESIRLGRRFLGAELKKSYFKEAVKNLTSVETAPKQLQMFG